MASVGDCGIGRRTCRAGELVCVRVNDRQAELCDLRDNDCDGQVDEGNPGGGANCANGLPGVCADWATICLDGQIVCNQDPPVDSELCNGLDDDCDGAIDEDNPEGGFECETEATGICRQGTTSCVEADITCVQVREPEAEKCNQLDDDCDGIYDEVDTVGRPCFTGQDGVCADGTTQCVRGANECVPVVPPSNEICDGLDNDCDGPADELDPGGGEACETGWGGACGVGTTVCEANRVRCLPAAVAAGERCDGIDEDCDGRIDEGARSDCGGCIDEPNEVCDGRDQDCDGLLDEDAPCDEGRLCRFGGCKSLCEADGDCGAGQLCFEGLCTNPCDGVDCPAGESCRGGRCFGQCEGVRCEPGQTCVAGACVSETCAAGECPEGFGCLDGACVDHPCNGLSCPPTEEGWTQLCRDGACVHSCALRNCPPGEVCVDGLCEVNPCDGFECPDGQVCASGRCIDDCDECAVGTVCLFGECRSHPCETARCAPAERCVLDHRGQAQCESDPDYAGQPVIIPDAAVPDAAPLPPPPEDAGVPDAAPAPMDADLDAAMADAAPAPTQTEGDAGGCSSTGGQRDLWFLFGLGLLLGLRRERG